MCALGSFPPLLAGVCCLGVCAWARASAAPRLSWPGVLGCVCLCARSACTPPLLAGVRGVDGCALVRVLAAPRHSWLGCWGVIVCAPLVPATPGWGVLCGCGCLGSGFGCAPPLPARVLGCVGVHVRAPLVPCHSWLWCAVWVCVLGLGIRLRPATPGWGVGVCVCLCARSASTPPLLAGVLGSVYVRVRALLVPCHSWQGCAVWVCVLGLGIRLRPANPGLGVRLCVCLFARSACTPPLLAGVRGVGGCAWAPASAAPRHYWLGCWGVRVRAPLVPATPGWGVLCGCVCLGSRLDCAPPLLAGVFGCVSVRVRVPLVLRQSWLGCAVWVCVLWLRIRLRPATPGSGVGVCVCLCARFAGTPPLLAAVRVVGVCARALASAAPRHSWFGCCAVRVRARRVPATPGWGCAVWVCVLGLGFRLRPATPGWGVVVCVCSFGMCMCSCARFACNPPLLAGLCGVGVCAWARVLAEPRHSCLGCWAVCVRLCARSSCTSPLPAGVCGVGVCAWARVSAAPRHSWLGCWGECVFLYALRWYPATPGWAARCGWVCLGLSFGCAPPLLAGVLWCACARSACPRHCWLECAVWVCVLGLGFGLRPATPGCSVGVCVFVCALRWYLTPPGRGAGCHWVCLGPGFSCALPLLAGVLGCACARSARPDHSWLGCAVLVCVFRLRFRLRPASPGWGVGVCVCSFGVCVCSCARPACTPPVLAGVCGVGVCAWARAWAAPRHSWLGCWGVCVRLCARSSCTPPLLAGVLGCVCVCVRAPLVPGHSWLQCALWVCVLGPWLRLRPATPGLGVVLCVCALRASPPLLAGGVLCGSVCLGSAFGCALPLLAGVLWCVCVPLGSVCVRVRALLVTRHSLLGCAVWVCVLGLGFWLSPSTPVFGVGLCVFVCVRAPPVLRHSRLGCAVWECVLGLGFRLRPATPGWGGGMSVCFCTRSAGTPPPLAGVRGVGGCAWALASAAPRHSSLGCCGVRVRAPLVPATAGWSVLCGCVCLGLGLGCAPPFLAVVLGCVCSFARSAGTSPLLAGVRGVGGCTWALASAAPCHSLLGCWGVRVRALLVPTTPGWGVLCWCVCLGSGFACVPPLLAGVLGCVCVLLGCVCVRVRAPLVPRQSWLGCAV